MPRPLPAPFDKAKIVAENRRARYDYFVEERLEAGIELQGTEVKALRGGEGSIAESYAAVEGEEVFLINSHIPQYGAGSWMNHEPRRKRKLLLKGREIARLHGAITRQGLTLVPLSIPTICFICSRLGTGAALSRALFWLAELTTASG